MKSLHEITIEDVQALFDSTILSRGEEYADEGNVQHVECINSHVLSAKVRGNQKYNVTISIDSEGDIICNCSCPCEFNCKHAAAVLLEWLERKDKHAESTSQSSQTNEKNISLILAKKSKQELITLVLELLQKYPHMKSLVHVDGKDMTCLIERLFANSWDFDDIAESTEQLNTLLESIKKNTNSATKDFFHEMKKCSQIMVTGLTIDSDETDLVEFLEEWFLTYGEIFASTKPTNDEKKHFLQEITALFQTAPYEYQDSLYKALLGMCKTPQDIQLVEEHFSSNTKKHDEDKESRIEFLLEAYEKLGLDNDYVRLAKTEGYVCEVIDKLISCNRLDEALDECIQYTEKLDAKQTETQTENYTASFFVSNEIGEKRIKILKKLGHKKDLQSFLLHMVLKTHDLSYVVKLKQEAQDKEWQKYLQLLVSDSKIKVNEDFLSRLYFHENDYKTAYDFADTITDLQYLELLANKLRAEFPVLACQLLRKLCFSYITYGSGWPYKKAGKILETIKMLDKDGVFFRKTKKQLLSEYKKKYSLMQILERV